MIRGKGNALTVILVMVIVMILGIVGWMAFDMIKQNSANNKAKNAVAEFKEEHVKKRVKDDTITNDSGNFFIGNGVTSTNLTSGKKTYLESYEVKGIIEIPKNNIEYPILSEVTKRSLELAVGILNGPGLNEVGNTVILGHNYRNGMFFSNNHLLSNGDEIKITDQSGNTITYVIYKMYETDPNDADYMLRDTGNAREISLSTCTDDSKSRLVIWAKEKENKTVENQ